MAPWKSLLLRALESNGQIKHSKFLQLVHFPFYFSQVQVFFLIYLLHGRFLCRICFQATIGTNGRPSNRTVVFREFEEGTDRIHIYTDSRSRKVLFICLGRSFIFRLRSLNSCGHCCLPMVFDAMIIWVS